jgi:hypothetical protein
MILRFEFTSRVYIACSVSCQKSVFDNLGSHFPQDEWTNKMIFILLATVTSNSTLVQQRIKQTVPVAKIILQRFLQCKGRNYKHSGDNVICNVLINFDLTFCHPQHQKAYLKQIHFLASLNHKRQKHFNFSIIYI